MLGKNLQRLRSERNLTQEELAEKAKISFRGYQDIEYGKIKSPRADTIKALSQALGVSIAELYGDQEKENSNKSNSELIAAIVLRLGSLNDNELRSVLGFIEDSLSARSSGGKSAL